jgi:hypothetical protein
LGTPILAQALPGQSFIEAPVAHCKAELCTQEGSQTGAWEPEKTSLKMVRRAKTENPSKP